MTSVTSTRNRTRSPLTQPSREAHLINAGQPHLVEDGEEEAADENHGEGAAHHPSQREEDAVVRHFSWDA